MAHAMELPQHNAVLAAHPRLTFRKDGYSYSVVTKNGHSVYVVSDGTRTLSLPIVWAMGAQAQTWVLERNGNMYESRVSYYPSIKGLEITTGNERLTPKTIDEAVGRPIGMDEAKACFNCHATNAIAGHQLDMKSLHPGITCERCHARAQAHAAGMIAGAFRRLFRSLWASKPQRTFQTSAGSAIAVGRPWCAPIGEVRRMSASSRTGWPTAGVSMEPIAASVALPATIRTSRWCGIFPTTIRSAWRVTDKQTRQAIHLRLTPKPAQLPSHNAQPAICHRSRYRMDFCISTIIRFAS